MDDYAAFLSHSDFTFKVARDQYPFANEAEPACAASDHRAVLCKGQQARRQCLADFPS